MQSKQNLDIKQIKILRDQTLVKKTQDNIIAQFLLKKSSQCRRRRNKVLEYNLTLEYIKELLLKQEYKDYYTGHRKL